MKIEFHLPFVFNLQVIETDERVPSMQVEIHVTIMQFQHILKYKGAFWIECNQWESFTKALRDSLVNNAIFHDMDDNFMLKVSKQDENFLLDWELKRTDTEGQLILAGFSSVITADMFSKIKDEFAEFPIWW